MHDSIVDDEQLDYLRERPDLSLIAYSALLKVCTTLPGGTDRHPALAPYAGDEARHRLAVVDAIAAEIGVQPGQIVLAWLAAQISPRRFALIGTTQVDRYRQAARALELELTPDQLARLDRT